MIRYYTLSHIVNNRDLFKVEAGVVYYFALDNTWRKSQLRSKEIIYLGKELTQEEVFMYLI